MFPYLTSSLFDCFCRLTLSVEVPFSFCKAELAWDSSLGRGIFEGLFSTKVGIWPRCVPRPVGVPLKVPLVVLMIKTVSKAGMVIAESPNCSVGACVANWRSYLLSKEQK